MSRQDTIRRFFDHRLGAVCGQLSDLPADVSVAFEITGPEAGSWVLEHTDRVRVRRGTHAWPDCRILVASVVFERMIQGALTATQAFLDGSLVVQGDVGLGLMLEAAWNMENAENSLV